MLRKSFSIVLVALLVVFVALGRQATEEEQLRQQLLSQEEFQALQGDQWILDSVDSLGDVGALASAVGTYLNTNTNNTVVTGLIHFDVPEAAGGFLQANLDSNLVADVRNLRDELEENPEVLTELLAESIEDVFFLELTNGLQQLIMRRSTLVFFIRSSLSSSVDLTQLVLIADAQVQKTIDFCSNADPAPSYC